MAGQLIKQRRTSSSRQTVSSKRLSVTRYCQTGGGCKYKYFSRIQLLNEGSLSLAAPAGHRILISGMVHALFYRPDKTLGTRNSESRSPTQGRYRRLT